MRHDNRGTVSEKAEVGVLAQSGALSPRTGCFELGRAPVPQLPGRNGSETPSLGLFSTGRLRGGLVFRLWFL